MSPGSQTVYCIDTSILIDLKRYPRDIFGVWQSLEDMITKDLAIAPKQVREELKNCDDDLYRWAVRQRRMFKALTREQANCVAEVVGKFPELAHMDRRVEAADPFLIALALAEKRASLFGTRQPTIHRARAGTDTDIVHPPFLEGNAPPASDWHAFLHARSLEGEAERMIVPFTQA